MSKTHKTGAYRWRNLVNGMVYVGGAYTSFEDRKCRHQRALRSGCHDNRYFQRAWNKYGDDAFVFEIIERCEPEQVASVEQKWLDYYDAGSKERSYNLSPFADKPPSALGKKRSAETKARMSAALKGNKNCLGVKHSEETKKRLSETAKKRMSDPKHLAASLKRLHTPAVHRKIGEAHRNRVRTEEERQAASERSKRLMADPERRKKIADAARTQWADPKRRAKMIRGMRKKAADPEHRARHAESARRLHADPEYREKVAERNRSLEHRAKVSAGMIGHKVSAACRAKLAATTKAMWQDEEKRAKIIAGMRANPPKPSEQARRKLSKLAKRQFRRNGKFSAKS